MAAELVGSLWWKNANKVHVSILPKNICTPASTRNKHQKRDRPPFLHHHIENQRKRNLLNFRTIHTKSTNRCPENQHYCYLRRSKYPDIQFQKVAKFESRMQKFLDNLGPYTRTKLKLGQADSKNRLAILINCMPTLYKRDQTTNFYQVITQCLEYEQYT